MKTLYLLFIPSIFFFTLSCKKSDNPVTPGDDKKITLGDVVDVTTQTIGTGGGTIKVIKSGDPLDGMEIIIPPNSFTQTKNFKISYAKILNHKLGDNFNPITPAIQIKYEGGYSTNEIKVKIPINLPNGHFASGFFFDETTGKLEGIPLVDLSSSYITISTSHFSSNNIIPKSRNSQDEESHGTLIISSSLESELAGHPVIATGFEPGFDDWEFVNYGSYIAPGGHCAGQSISAIWYYFAKNLRGEKALFHGYDQIFDPSYPPDYMWFDNPRGIRFASVIQSESNFENWMHKMDLQVLKPKNTFYTFIHNMIVTGEPQLLIIRRISPDTIGHAMIVYKIDPILKKMYVADPNFPGNRVHDKTTTAVRIIDFDGTNFLPYKTTDNADNPETSFNQFGYFGKSAFIDFSTIQTKWVEFLNGTIGNNKFPSYQIVNEATGQPIPEQMTVNNSELKISVRSSGCDGAIPGTTDHQPFEIVNDQGATLEYVSGGNGIGLVTLAQGTNKLGIYIKGKKMHEGQLISKFVDFKWITVNNTQTTQPKLTIKINGDSLNILKKKTYKFTATLSGANLPQKQKYLWNFDNTGWLTKYGDNTYTYYYNKTGSFTVIAALLDSSTGSQIAEGRIQVNVREPSTNYEKLISSYRFDLNLYAKMNFSNQPDPLYSSYDYNLLRDWYYSEIEWDQSNNFFVNYNYKISPVTSGGDTTYVTGSLSGLITSDGQMLYNLSNTEKREVISKSDGTIKSQRNQSLLVSNVPFNLFESTYSGGFHQGAQISSYINGININGFYYNASNELVNYQLQSVEYSAPTNTPSLRFTFYRR